VRHIQGGQSIQFSVDRLMRPSACWTIFWGSECCLAVWSVCLELVLTPVSRYMMPSLQQIFLWVDSSRFLFSTLQYQLQDSMKPLNYLLFSYETDLTSLWYFLYLHRLLARLGMYIFVVWWNEILIFKENLCVLLWYAWFFKKMLRCVLSFWSYRLQYGSGTPYMLVAGSTYICYHE